MRILQVLAGLGAGGAERLVLHLGRWLQCQGHVVEVVNIYRDTTLQSEFEAAGVCVRNMRMTPYVSQWYPGALVSYLRRFQADVVHCHETAWVKSALACRWAHVPCVFTLHLRHEQWFRNDQRRLRQAASATDYCVGVAPEIPSLFVDFLGMPAERVRYIRNGIPDIHSVEKPSVDWVCDIPPDAKLVGMVGRFDEIQKDQMTLVQAMAMVQDVVPEAHLLLVGEGPRRAEVEQLVSQLGMSRCVHFLGLRRDVPVVLHHLDVFVLSSRHEGESLAILEAMSAQRPIVATAVGGTPGLLANGECGLLVPPGDAQAMAQAIVELLTNKTKAGELARRARERFLREYTIDRMGERYLELYEKAIAQHREKT